MIEKLTTRQLLDYNLFAFHTKLIIGFDVIFLTEYMDYIKREDAIEHMTKLYMALISGDLNNVKVA